MSRPTDPDDTARPEGNEVAVCGMSGRFPAARDVESFWRNLRDGVESITTFSEEELLAAGEAPEQLADPAYVKVRPILDDVELFDAEFFGFTPREAEILDPQHRIFLECAWHALEDAGCDPQRFRGAVSLHAGASFSNYLVHNLYRNRSVMEDFGDLQSTIYNVQDALVTMAAYKLGLRGPCCAVQTFCSTSLVAVHLACQSLLNYECDLALAGGVTVYVPQKSGYRFEEGSILSPDGRCRAFDAGANGTVFGSGVGVVALRRLGDALRDGHTVRAVIRGSAVNNDGSLKVSYAAPGVVGQTEVIVEALAASGVDPETIDAVEAHGTGTAMGDPAEIAALTKAFRTRTARTGYCAVGSVKTNVGHLDAAAGVTGLIKMILSLQHGQLPPSLNFERANPQIDFASTPFYVNTGLREWPRRGGPRRGAVSAFGVGGTNAHVIVEEAPRERSVAGGDESPQLIVVSARTPSALERASHELATHLRSHPKLDLADVAYTLQTGRRAFAARRALVARSRESAIRALEAEGPERLADASCERSDPPVAFLFRDAAVPDASGVLALGARESAFRAALKDCDDALRERHGVALASALAGAAAARRVATSALGEELFADLACFSVQYALVALWASWGIRPEAFVGAGVGECAAACAAGAARLESALALLAARRRALESGAGADGIAAAVTGLELSAPRRTWLSVYAGGPVSGEQARAAGFWGALLRASPAPEAAAALAAGAGRLSVTVDEALAPGASTAGGEAPIAPELLRRTLGRLWLGGVDPDWRGLHAGARRRLVPLPGYPFERERHWVDPPEPVDPATVKEGDPEAWLYHPVWRTVQPLAAKPPQLGRGRYLVFVGRDGVGSAAATALREHGAEVLTVAAGDGLEGDSRSGYRIDPERAEHYAELVAELRRAGPLPAHIVHTWAADGIDGSHEERFAAASRVGFYSLLHLARALEDVRDVERHELLIVSTGLQDVIGDEPLAPELAPLLAFCTVAPQEYHRMRCRSLDLDTGSATRAAVLLHELTAAAGEPFVAYRGGRRWSRGFERLAAEPLAVPARVRPRGVYLITGGLGDIGYVLAASLASGTRARLVLVNRSELPPRGEWDERLAQPGDGEAVARRIGRVRALERAGAEVMAAKADVADPDQMAAVLASARRRFGRIDGAIHAAGLLAREDFVPIQQLTVSHCQRLFEAKVRGLVVVDELLGDEAADFRLAISSLSTVLGGVGYAAYAAANAFMDQFAAARSRESTPSWTSVGFDHWLLGAGRGLVDGDVAGLGITPAEGVRLFSRILRLAPLSRLVVSTSALEARLERWLQAPGAAADDGGGAAARSRPRLASDFVPPRGTVEERICEIWQQLLGVPRVGAQDDFFELGGHSLFAARVLSRLREAFGVSLPLTAIFDAPTVTQLADRVSLAIASRDPESPEADASHERVEIEL